jgi:hypothetical protein
MTERQLKQKHLFDEMARRLPARLLLADAISEQLGISVDAAYRRIRGETIVDLDEAVLLCSRFGLSLDELTGLSGGDAKYRYAPLDLNDRARYYTYMQNLSVAVQRLRAAGGEVKLSAMDVPFFHFLGFSELTFFKLFVWMGSVYTVPASFEEFRRTIESEELLRCYETIHTDFLHIPSSEIWTSRTIDIFLRQLVYHVETGRFQSRETALSLCRRFGELIETVRRWAEQGAKHPSGKPAYRFFRGEIDPENNFILMKQPGHSSCLIKLFTINSISIFDERFCAETEEWLDHLARRSTLLSGTAERDRYLFFDDQQQKIGAAMDAIASDGKIPSGRKLK